MCCDFPEPCSMDYALSGPLIVMEGGFSASSMSDFQHSPHNARLQPISQNEPVSSWRPKAPIDLNNPPWIQVSLGSIKV